MSNREELAKEIHRCYLNTSKRLQPESYNAKAQKEYDELTEEQKEFDRDLADYIIQREEKVRVMAKLDVCRKINYILGEIDNDSHTYEILKDLKEEIISESKEKE